MRPIINNDLTGFLISEDMVNRYDTYVPEPGPQSEDSSAAIENFFARKTFGQRVKYIFSSGNTPRPTTGRQAGVRRRYQRDY